MMRQVLESIPGIEYYPIVALVLFFGFFVGLTVWFFTADRRRLQEIAELPLDDHSHQHDLA
jgi:cbb3-type cytochrome oxidase subunit 3